MFTTTILCAVVTFGMKLGDELCGYPQDEKGDGLPMSTAAENDEQWVKVCGRNKCSPEVDTLEREKELPTTAEKEALTTFEEAQKAGGASMAEKEAKERAEQEFTKRKREVDEAREARNGAPVAIPASVAKQSGLIQGVSDLTSDDKYDEARCLAEAELCPLPNVTPEMLTKVLDWCWHQTENGVEPTDIQKPLKSTNLIECGASEWDVEYLNIEQETLFELILAANYLNIKGLLDLTCAKVASMIKGKDTEAIRKQFNIVNEFTPEEQAQVEEENRWCREGCVDAAGSDSRAAPPTVHH